MDDHKSLSVSCANATKTIKSALIWHPHAVIRIITVKTYGKGPCISYYYGYLMFVYLNFWLDTTTKYRENIKGVRGYTFQCVGLVLEKDAYWGSTEHDVLIFPMKFCAIPYINYGPYLLWGTVSEVAGKQSDDIVTQYHDADFVNI